MNFPKVFVSYRPIFLQITASIDFKDRFGEHVFLEVGKSRDTLETFGFRFTKQTIVLIVLDSFLVATKTLDALYGEGTFATFTPI